MSAPTKTAEACRAATARLRDFSLEQLHPRLPLRFPCHGGADVPATFRTRSWYTYPGWAGLADGDALANAGALYIALHLIDFSPLRGELVALRGLHVNGRGGTPFDKEICYVLPKNPHAAAGVFDPAPPRGLRRARDAPAANCDANGDAYAYRDARSRPR